MKRQCVLMCVCVCVVLRLVDHSYEELLEEDTGIDIRFVLQPCFL